MLTPSCLTTGRSDFLNLFDGNGIETRRFGAPSLLIEGEAGLGKSTLALQLAVNAVNEGHATCLYYTFEQSAVEIRHISDIFNWDVSIREVNYSTEKEADFGDFNIIDAADLIELPIDAIKSKMDKQIRAVIGASMMGTQDAKTPIVVLDSIGAVPELVKGERKHVGALLQMAREANSILILVREHDETLMDSPSEYLTNVVIDMRMQIPDHARTTEGIPIPHKVMVIKKSRNQFSHRGPHEFEILKPKTKRDLGGISVYPSLESISSTAAEIADSFETSNESDEFGAFGIKDLDLALGKAFGKLGVRLGDSLLVKGPPGCLKTQLGIQFLLNAYREQQEPTLFVSCRMDEQALGGLDIYSGEEELEKFTKTLAFIDARDPYRTPAQTMALIRETIERYEAIDVSSIGRHSSPTGSQQRIRRAVIFGIGMLETLPAFRNRALPFLQVLIQYFRRKKITGVFIDWPRLKRDVPASQVELAGDFLSGALEIELIKTDVKDARVERHISITRRDHRFDDNELGILSVDKKKLKIQRIR